MTNYIPENISIRKRRHDVGYEVCSFTDEDVVADYVLEAKYNKVVKELKQAKDDLENEKRNSNRNDFTGTQRLY